MFWEDYAIQIFPLLGGVILGRAVRYVLKFCPESCLQREEGADPGSHTRHALICHGRGGGGSDVRGSGIDHEQRGR